ncbi:MAG: hypothetical protein ABEH38_06310 [Flavobacteriales bacterium]
MKQLDLSKKGIQAKIYVPKKDPKKGIRPAKLKRSKRGGALITAGNPFRMRVMQAPPARKIAKKKKDIKNMSGALKITFLKENDSLLLYKKSLPGGGKKMFSFYLTKKVKGKPFVFEAGNGEFSKKDVEKMIRSANSIQPKKQKKTS